jgi:curli biogenesis system outer membrane secretion channel CsgG
MKKGLGMLSVLVLFSMIMFSFGECIAAEGGLRYSISVAKFQNRSNWSGHWNLGDAWGAVLTDSLNQTGKFIVLGEKDMRQEAMQEQDFAASGRAAGGGKKVVTGQMTPAQLLIKGDITHFSDTTQSGKGGFGYKGFRIGGSASEAEINVVMYIVDSSTGQVMASKKCYGKVSKTGLTLGLSKGGFSGDVGGFKKTNAGKAMEKAVDEGVEFLTSKLESIPWTGTIILAKNGKVYINRGTREGVSVGQTFNVGKSEVLRDPDTGEVLDQSLEKVGTIKVLKVKEKLSICKILNGQGITKGMTVAQPQ